jgi:hypothetical protein
MVIKRFGYENGLNIIAPLKCGTRWLEEKTNPIKIEELSTIDKINGITKKTYWVYRDNREHLISALRTEIRNAIEFGENNTNSIVDGFIKGTGTHWSTELYKFMYLHWNRVEFDLIHLNDLSNLFVGVEYIQENYDMNHYHKTKHTKEDIIELVDSTKINALYELSDIDYKWLIKILNKEHNLI